MEWEGPPEETEMDVKQIAVVKKKKIEDVVGLNVNLSLGVRRDFYEKLIQ